MENLLALILYYSGLIKSVRNKGKRYAKILAFHSVSQSDNYFVKGPSEIWISDSLLIKHLSYLRKHYHIISLKELVESLNKGAIPERSVVITFDDGFSDNYYFAYPILKKKQMPATIFLTTEAIDNRKPIWLQKLNYLVNKFGIDKVSDRMKGLSDYLQFNGSVTHANSGNSAHKQFETFLAYNVTKKRREEILIRLFSEFDIAMENVFSKDKVFLSWEEIKKMQANGICFGNHGESHTPFSTLSKDDQKTEVLNSKNIIEHHLEQSFLPFAYPFGQKRDFTNVTTRLIDEAGHSCILTAMPTLNHADTSHRELGRIVVGNVPVYRLAYELEKSVIKRWLKHQ